MPAKTPVDRQAPAATDQQAPAAPTTTKPVKRKPVAPPAERTLRLASGAREQPVSSALPYPILALGLLAGILLLSAAVGWLARRRT